MLKYIHSIHVGVSLLCDFRLLGRKCGAGICAPKGSRLTKSRGGAEEARRRKSVRWWWWGREERLGKGRG